jgi:hypothetical protein
MLIASQIVFSATAKSGFGPALIGPGNARQSRYWSRNTRKLLRRALEPGFSARLHDDRIHSIRCDAGRAEAPQRWVG